MQKELLRLHESMQEIFLGAGENMAWATRATMTYHLWGLRWKLTWLDLWLKLGRRETAWY